MLLQAFEAPPHFELRTPVCKHVDVNSTAGVLKGEPRLTLARCDAFPGNYESVFEYLQFLQALQETATLRRRSPHSEKEVDARVVDAEAQAILDERREQRPEPAEGQRERNAARGSEEEKGVHKPSVVSCPNRPRMQELTVQKAVGDETGISSVKDLLETIRAIERGLLTRFALARWIHDVFEVQR